MSKVLAFLCAPMDLQHDLAEIPPDGYKRLNQNKPLPPLPTIEGPIREYWAMGLSKKSIRQKLLTRHVDTRWYGLGERSFRKLTTELGLHGTRQQGVQVTDLIEPMKKLRIRYPHAGTRECISVLFHRNNGMKVPKRVMMEYFATFEPELVRQRRSNRLKRKRFWAAGVNDLWAVDQHDKWKVKFRLALHIGIEPFSGKTLWLKVWWTNSNPRLILSYYLEVVRKLGCKYLLEFISGRVQSERITDAPLITQSDPGSENYFLARGHTIIRHWHDKSLEGTLQHRFMWKKKNIMPEISWSQMRRRETPGLEDELDKGVNSGWYDTTNILHCLVFRWVWIPVIQLELDTYRDRINQTSKRADKNKILPQGPPNDIFQYPDDYGSMDFKVNVMPASVEFVQKELAPLEHDVFELVPPHFDELACKFLGEMGPDFATVTLDKAWAVYLFLRDKFEAINSLQMPSTVEDIEDEAEEAFVQNIHEQIKKLTPLRNINDGSQALPAYIGGLNSGEGLDRHQQDEADQRVDEDEPRDVLMNKSIEDDMLLHVPRFSDDEDEDVDPFVQDHEW